MENKTKFYTDYQSLKDSIETITKNTDGYNYTYADLIAVKDSTDKAITNNGFIKIQTVKEGQGTYSREYITHLKNDKQYTQFQEKTKMESQAYVLNTKLIHKETGEVIECNIPLYSDDLDPRAIGSAITYMRRYSLYVILDLKTEDDDGAAASKKVKSGGFNKAKTPLPTEFGAAKQFLIDCDNPKMYYGEAKNWEDWMQKAELIAIIYPK